MIAQDALTEAERIRIARAVIADGIGDLEHAEADHMPVKALIDTQVWLDNRLTRLRREERGSRVMVLPSPREPSR